MSYLPLPHTLSKCMEEPSGILLAGGRGRRLGGYKATVMLLDKPIILWPYAALRSLCGEVIVVHGREENKRELQPILHDAILIGDEECGPLGGLLQGAQVARGKWLLVAPCDAPLLSAELYDAMLRSSGPDGCISVSGQRENPVVAAYRREPLVRVARQLVASGRRSLSAVIPLLRLRRLREGDLVNLPYGRDSLLDVDTSEDLRRAEEILRDYPARCDA